MGGVSAVTDFVGDTVGGVVDAVSDVGSSVDDFVNDEIPGGWVTVGLAAAGASALGGAEGAAAAGADAGLAMPFSEIMELPTAELLSGYDAATAGAAGWSGLDMGDTIPYTEQQIAGLYPPDNAFTSGVPVVDMSTPAVGVSTLPGLTDTLTGALIGGAAGAATGGAIEDEFTPDIPAAAPTYTPKPDKTNWSAKFDAPVAYATPRFDLPEFDDKTIGYEKVSPSSVAGPLLMGAGDVDYASELIKELRDSSQTPMFGNNGITMYKAVTK